MQIPEKNFVRVCKKCLLTKKTGPVKTKPDNAETFSSQELLDST